MQRGIAAAAPAPRRGGAHPRKEPELKRSRQASTPAATTSVSAGRPMRALQRGRGGRAGRGGGVGSWGSLWATCGAAWRRRRSAGWRGVYRGLSAADPCRPWLHPRPSCLPPTSPQSPGSLVAALCPLGLPFSLLGHGRQRRSRPRPPPPHPAGAAHARAGCGRPQLGRRSPRWAPERGFAGGPSGWLGARTRWVDSRASGAASPGIAQTRRPVRRSARA